MSRPHFTLLRRLWWTLLLVLVAVGGGGLAARADQRHDTEHRPELTYLADELAAPRIADLRRDVAALDEQVGRLTEAALDALTALSRLDSAAVTATLADGDEAAAAAEAPIEPLTAARAELAAAMDELRLGEHRRQQLERLDLAIASAGGVGEAWRSVASVSRLAAGLIEPLLLHDELLAQAALAGREARWRDALDALDLAAAPRAEIAAVRDQLAAAGGSGTDATELDGLVANSGAYAAALRDLYGLILRRGSVEGAQVDALAEQARLAQAALPADLASLGAIVAGAAGQPVTAGLEAIEQARGDIRAVLDETP